MDCSDIPRGSGYGSKNKNGCFELSVKCHIPVCLMEHPVEPVLSGKSERTKKGGKADASYNESLPRVQCN